MSITTEKVGTRVYVTGNTYAIKDQLKSAGCHWDGDRKQWWIGAAKQESIASLVTSIADAPPPVEDLSKCRLLGKAQYKGRSYYVIGDSTKTEKYRLTVLDGSIVFWAAKALCQWEKTYQPRTRFGGYGRGQVQEYQTLGSIQRFVAEQKEARESGAELCAECGKPGDLIEDLEDGLSKHRHCCDIPS